MKRRTLIGGVLFLLVVVAALSATASSSAGQISSPARAPYTMQGGTPTSVPTCVPSWAIVANPEIDAYGSTLQGVDSVSSTDAWAVGQLLTDRESNRKRPVETRQLPSSDGKAEGPQGGFNVLNILIEHWDGTSWSVVAGQNLGDDDNVLFSVDAISTSDVWAAGYYVNEFGISQTLIEHWDGMSWSVVPSPNTGGLLDNRLLSIEAVSSTDAWAVGYYYDEDAIARTLTLHWDGTDWRVIDSPNNGDETRNNYLYDLAVVSSGDIWAAGYYLNPNGLPRSLLLRWDGSQWTTTPSPGIGSGPNYLFSIDASSATDVWAVGAYSPTNYYSRPLTQHWDGTQWTVIASPYSDSGADTLYGVETVSATDAWAVGRIGGYSSAPKVLAQHWDGTSWTQVNAPSPLAYPTFTFYSVDVVGTNDVWAVGGNGDYYAFEQIIEHYSTACLTCSTRFIDVPEGSTYYNSIQCLACQGLIGGYGSPPEPIPTGQPFATASPTPAIVEFRPNNTITRGQLAKIVSNSAGYTDDPGWQLFEDVYPYSYYSPFYTWINRLAIHGIMNGYPCGGENEPCGYNNLPYFRPNAETTRGQIAKVVSIAAGYTETHTELFFTDVPTSHQFYQWIARLYSRGLIGGYPCGSTGEPCDSENRPYFRPNANATRGQVTKIVAKAFFPNCYVP
ncbi:MAG TPA: S-layer homology domain-containing protein [Chloroflexia bacterium]|nr:S-layer homology domain-containing protein [Chloroflexia bacterium]